MLSSFSLPKPPMYPSVPSSVLIYTWFILLLIANNSAFHSDNMLVWTETWMGSLFILLYFSFICTRSQIGAFCVQIVKLSSEYRGVCFFCALYSLLRREVRSLLWEHCLWSHAGSSLSALQNTSLEEADIGNFFFSFFLFFFYCRSFCLYNKAGINLGISMKEMALNKPL